MDIVIVDDDVTLAMMMTLVLTTRGHQVAVFGSAEEASNYIEDKTPEVLLLDLALPGRDGWSVLDALEKQLERKPVSTVIISGQKVSQKAMTEHGVRSHLRKPFGMKDLLDVVTNLQELPKSSHHHRPSAQIA